MVETRKYKHPFPGELHDLGKIPIELIREISSHFVSSNFQPDLVGSMIKKGEESIGTNDVMRELDSRLIVDGSVDSDESIGRIQMSKLYLQHRETVEKLIKNFMPDRGAKNKNKQNHFANMVEAIDKFLLR